MPDKSRIVPERWCYDCPLWKKECWGHIDAKTCWFRKEVLRLKIMKKYAGKNNEEKRHGLYELVYPDEM